MRKEQGNVRNKAASPLGLGVGVIAQIGVACFSGVSLVFYTILNASKGLYAPFYVTEVICQSLILA